jgi:hypothetical protein
MIMRSHGKGETWISNMQQFMGRQVRPLAFAPQAGERLTAAGIAFEHVTDASVATLRQASPQAPALVVVLPRTNLQAGGKLAQRHYIVVDGIHQMRTGPFMAEEFVRIRCPGDGGQYLIPVREFEQLWVRQGGKHQVILTKPGS